jgi:GMP synthase-like glutamine amidotransferase
MGGGKGVVVLKASSSVGAADDGVTADGETSATRPSLHFCMLGCEDKPPYGPTTHTATMILNLFQQAAEKEKIDLDITISIYRVQQFDYPESYTDFDGVLLPGSFSAAYDEDDWIVKLKEVIRNDLWANKVPTLGICFGHQVLAHALDGGLARKCPAGPQAGFRFLDAMTETSNAFVAKPESRMPLLYTHGDMVEKLPTMATRLGGTSTVPILAGVYSSSLSEESTNEEPVFVTFQAHPEYASEGPDQPTLKTILAMMEERGDISGEERKTAMCAVEEQWETIYESSVHVLVSTCRLLKWFPESQ